MSATAAATFITVVVAIVGGYAYSVHTIVSRIDRRLERIEDRLSTLEVNLGRIGQRLDDHVTDHPGPTERLVQR
jgi:hypothetical protein